MKRKYFCLLFIFIIISCKEKEISLTEKTNIALEMLDLNCNLDVLPDYYINGKIGDEEFCHYEDGHYYSYTVVGSSFTTFSPSVSTNDTSGITNFARFFNFSFHPVWESDFPGEELGIHIVLPDTGEYADELFKLLRNPSLDFTSFESEKSGVRLRFDLIIRLNSESEEFEIVTFDTQEGDQSNSFFNIDSFSLNQQEEFFSGVVKFDFGANLYHLPNANGFEGFWRRVEAEMVMAFQVPL